MTSNALTALQAYHWPGNIRELGNVLERAVVLASGSTIDTDDLAFMTENQSGTQIAQHSLNLDARLADLEERLLREALEATRDVKAKAARLLGVKESALYYKLEKYGLLKKR